MEIDLKNFLKTFEIKQMYVCNSIDINNISLLKELKLPTYESYKENTLFIGVYKITDYIRINKHKGKKMILWVGNDADITNINRVNLMKSIKNSIHIALNEEIYNNLIKIYYKSNVKNIYNIINKFRIKNESSIFIKRYNLEQIKISDVIKNKETYSKKLYLPKYSDNKKNTLFIGVYNKNDYKKVFEHLGKKVIIWGGNDANTSNPRRLKFMKKIKNAIHIAKSNKIYENLLKIYNSNSINFINDFTNLEDDTSKYKFFKIKKKKFNFDQKFYIISFINYAYYDVFNIWYKFYKLYNIEYDIIIFCLDDKVYDMIDKLNIKNVKLVNLSYTFNLKSIWILRCEALDYLVNDKNLSILHTDFDCIWLKNLFNFDFNENNRKTYDIISSVGTIFPHKMCLKNYFVLCMGLIYFNNSEMSKQMIKNILSNVNNSKDDQACINMLCINLKFEYPNTYYKNLYKNKYYREYSDNIYCNDKYKMLILPHSLYLRNHKSLNYEDSKLITFHPLLPKDRNSKLEILNYKNLCNRFINKKLINYIFYHDENELNKYFNLHNNSHFKTIDLNKIKLNTNLINNDFDFSILALNEYNGLLDIKSEYNFIGCFTYSIPKKYSDIWSNITGNKMFSKNKFKFSDLIEKELNFDPNKIYCIEIKEIEEKYNNIFTRLHNSNYGINNDTQLKFPIKGPVKTSFIMINEKFTEFQAWYKSAINWYINETDIHLSINENEMNLLGKSKKEIMVAKLRYNYGYVLERFQSYYFYQKYKNNLVSLQNFLKENL